MQKLVIIIILVLSIAFTNAQDYAAGVLPYRIGDDNEVYILLGLESNYWENFIGGYEKFDGGDIIETATREFHQETNCFF